MKYLSEVEPLINTAITNKFNIFTKNEFTYIFNIFTTTVFTGIYASVSSLLFTPNSLFQVMLYCTAENNNPFEKFKPGPICFSTSCNFQLKIQSIRLRQICVTRNKEENAIHDILILRTIETFDFKFKELSPVLIAKKAASCPVTSFPSEPLQGAPSQHVPTKGISFRQDPELNVFVGVSPLRLVCS